MKKFNLFKMLAVLIVLITSVSQASATFYLYKTGTGNNPGRGTKVATFGNDNNAIWVSNTSSASKFYVSNTTGTGGSSTDYLNSENTFNINSTYTQYLYGSTNNQYNHSRQMTPVNGGVYRFSFWVDGDGKFKYQPYIIVGNGSGNWLGGNDWSDSQTSNIATSSKTYSNCPAGPKNFRIIPYGEWDNDHGYAQVSTCNVPYYEDEDNNIAFTTVAQANITIGFDGTNITISVSYNSSDLTALKEQILNNDKIMFYFGDEKGSNNSGQKVKYLNKSGAHDYINANRSFIYNDGTRNNYLGVAIADPSTTYKISDWYDWAGVSIGSNADPGARYAFYNDGGDKVRKTNGVAPTWSTSSVSIAKGTTNSGLSASCASNSSLGRSHTITYYYTQDNGTTWTNFNPASVASLAVGTYTVRALAHDGNIYVRSNPATLTVYAAITLNNHGADSGKEGTTSVNAVKGANTSAITPPQKTGYVFQGYYTGENGAGTQIIDNTGAWLANKSGYTDNSSPCKYNATTNSTLHAKWTPVTWKLQSTRGDHGTFTGTGPYTLDVTYNSATMDWGAARFDLNGTSYICNNYTIGTSGKLDLRVSSGYTAINGITNGASYTFTITYENATWYVQIEEAAAPCTTPTIAWNTTPANGVAGGNMTASVTTNQTSPTITWNSSNTSAATVNSSGVITYVAAGNTRITASYTGDGSTYCSTTASVYQDITVSAAVADAWSLWYWGESETKIGDFIPDGGDSHHLDFELSASNFQTLWLKNNSTQYVAPNINANTVTNVTVTESPGRFRDDATKGYYRFTIYKDGGGAWKLDASPIYRVTYNDNGATSGTAPTDAAGYVSGATVTVKGNTGSLAKTGYDFGGWNLAADGSGTNYTAGSGTFSITANTELFAKWNAQNYSIIYKDQGDVAFSGSHVDSPSAHPTTHTYGTATSLNSATKTGYTFGGWFDNSACTGEAVTSLGATAYSDDITLYAQWSENMSTVSVVASPTGAGTFSSTSVSAGVDTKPTVTATARPGYKFGSWGITGGATTSGSTDNPVTITGKGAGAAATLTATFNRTYAYLQGRLTVYNSARNSETHTASSKGGWDENSTRIEMDYDETNHRFYRHTYKTPSELKAQINSNDQCFSITTSTVSGSLTNPTTYHPAENADLTTKGSANKKSAQTSTITNNYKFNSTTTNGYAILYFDESGVWFELEHTLKYNSNGGSGSAPAGTTYYDNGTNVIVADNTFTARPYYTFGGWNINQYSTSTNYAAGSTIKMTANRTLYAKWTRTITLNQNDATTEGTTSITGTYKCATLPSITNPQKTGYTFDGWYTEAAGDGTGNHVINTSGELQASMYHWTDANGRFDRTTEKDGAPLYAKWVQTITLNYNSANHGSGDNTSATVTYKQTALTNITHCTPASGYHLVGYYTAETGGTMILDDDGSFAGTDITVSTDPYISGGKWVHPGATTLYAHYEPNTYTVTLKPNGGTGDDQVVTATYGAAMPTTLSDGSTPITAPTKTGYDFSGYTRLSDGTGTKYYNTDLSSANTWGRTSDTDIYAKWTAKSYTVTLSQSGETGYGSSGSKSTVSATYNSAMPSMGTAPVGADGYKFQGYYSGENGTGTQYYDADGTSVHTWDIAEATILHAYFKKAEITNLVVEPSIVEPGEEVVVTPTISPIPEGNVQICWEVQYNNNGNPYPTQPIFIQGPDNSVRFTVPAVSATYRIQAQLKATHDCGGTVLNTNYTTFQVAGTHDVTIRYQDGSGRTIKASETKEGVEPLNWSDGITAPSITGYTFHHWLAGDGITLSKDGSSTHASDTAEVATVYIKAVYEGSLTAVYSKKNMIYFYNTLGWSNVHVYFYSSDKYWVEDHIAGQGCGTGSQQNYSVDGKQAYYRGYHGNMTQIEGTNIWYYDYEAAHGAKDNGEIKGYKNVVFVETEQDNYSFFYNNKACRRSDFEHALPMFIPLTGQTANMKNGTAYTSNGYWMNYPESTGYTLNIYNTWDANKSSGVARSFAFPYSSDMKMPLKVDVEFNDANVHEYWFMVTRNDGNYYGVNYTMNQNYNDAQALTSDNDKVKIVTSASGIYTFTLTYQDDLDFYIDVDFPVAVNDYRITYNDNATWSNGAHNAGWQHPSDVITKIDGEATEAKKDIVSFFISKGEGITASMKFQYASAINETSGAITWTDVDGGAINLSSFSSDITEAGVYNVYVSQPVGGGIRVDSIKPYTGNYYIRTNCAGNTKWDSFRALDHQMTYSDYTETEHGYSHYYAHWVTSGTNVKFTIANDYSMCISDTLEADTYTGQSLVADANIRFMWNQKTNVISRAYISGSSNISDRFLVLEGDSKMYDEDGNALSISGLNANEINLVDDQNFIYERMIQVNTGARAKLTAKYNNKVQYFRGSDGEFGDETTVELLGGSAEGKHKMRIVYDFKTNRLVTAYIPSTNIDDPIAINADLMIIREHQGAGQQLTFTGDGALSEVHTVYGVMRFNRWTLNNKEKDYPHAIVGDPKSRFERGLYWISFPFDVNLSDVFGFGTYGVDWIIEYYDGEGRAASGYWIDSPSFWRFVMPADRADFVLKAGKGYVLALELDNMKDGNTSFWNNNIEQVELFFPSAEEVEDIQSTTVKTTAHEHACTIDRTVPKGGSDISENRTRADSHWNMIGVPSYANYGSTLTSDGISSTITWNEAPYTNDLPFLYEWNAVDNSYTVQSGTTYPFKSMHSYMVQYHGDLYWALASATPASPVAARRNAEGVQDVEFRMEIQQDEKMIDQTFVRMSNDAEVSAEFRFDEDLFKELNSNKANIYTYIENYIPAAGNILPTSDQTTLVPVGVKIPANGEYTFAIPDGTQGIGVTLIDNETGARTSLSAFEYGIYLTAGDHNERFMLEISPISSMPTEVEVVDSQESIDDRTRKVIIDGVMYIIREGKMYDARGARVE